MQVVDLETCSGQQLLFSSESFKNHKYLASGTTNTQVLLLKKHLAFFFPNEEVFLELSSLLVTGKGFSAIEIPSAFMKA